MSRNTGPAPVFLRYCLQGYVACNKTPPQERKTTEQECKVLQRLRHPGIVCYEDSFVHKNRQV